MFGAVPAILTVYFIILAVSAASGAPWALSNQTYLYMNGWFHYAKLYAALAGCIGFMMIKYGWGIGKTHWFKAYPFVIVAINILIAVASDFESAFKGWYQWWLSSEDVWLYGGWHNVFNGIAGIINIFCDMARHDLGLHHRLRYLEFCLHLQLSADTLLVLRNRSAAGSYDRSAFVEQGWLDHEPCTYVMYLVYVRSGISAIPGNTF